MHAESFAGCVSSLHLGSDTPRLLWWSGPMKALRVAASFIYFLLLHFWPGLVPLKRNFLYLFLDARINIEWYNVG